MASSEPIGNMPQKRRDATQRKAWALLCIVLGHRASTVAANVNSAVNYGTSIPSVPATLNTQELQDQEPHIGTAADTASLPPTTVTVGYRPDHWATNDTQWRSWKSTRSDWPENGTQCKNDISQFSQHLVGEACQFSNGSLALRGWQVHSKTNSSSACSSVSVEYGCAPSNLFSTVVATLWTDAFHLGKIDSLGAPQANVSCLAGTTVREKGLSANDKNSSVYVLPRTGALQSFAFEPCINCPEKLARFVYNCSFPAADSGAVFDECVRFKTPLFNFLLSFAPLTPGIEALSGPEAVPGSEAQQVVCPKGFLLSNFWLEQERGQLDPIFKFYNYSAHYNYACCRARQDRSRVRLAPFVDVGETALAAAKKYDVAESAIVLENLRFLPESLCRHSLPPGFFSVPDPCYGPRPDPNSFALRIPWSLTPDEANELGDFAAAVMTASPGTKLARDMVDYIRVMVTVLAPIDVVVMDAMQRLVQAWAPELGRRVFSRKTGKLLRVFRGGAATHTDTQKTFLAVYLMGSVLSAQTNATALAVFDAILAYNVSLARRVDRLQDAISAKLCNDMNQDAAQRAMEQIPQSEAVGDLSALITPEQESILCFDRAAGNSSSSSTAAEATAPRRPAKRDFFAAMAASMLPYVLAICDGSYECRLGWSKDPVTGRASVLAATDLEQYGRMVPVDAKVAITDGYWPSVQALVGNQTFDPATERIEHVWEFQHQGVEDERTYNPAAAIFGFLIGLFVAIVVIYLIVWVAHLIQEYQHSDTLERGSDVDGQPVFDLKPLEMPLKFRFSNELSAILPPARRFELCRENWAANAWTSPPALDARLPFLPAGVRSTPISRFLPPDWELSGDLAPGGFLDPRTRWLRYPLGNDHTGLMPPSEGIASYGKKPTEVRTPTARTTCLPPPFPPPPPAEDSPNNRERCPEFNYDNEYPTSIEPIQVGNKSSGSRSLLERRRETIPTDKQCNSTAKGIGKQCLKFDIQGAWLFRFLGAAAAEIRDLARAYPVFWVSFTRGVSNAI